MSAHPIQPAGWRLFLGFLLAPISPAIAYTLVIVAYDWRRVWDMIPLTLIIGGYIPAFFVGLPVYAFARWKLSPTILNLTLAGVFVAAFPWLLLGLLPVSGEASIDSHATVIDGHLTWYGLLELLRFLGQIVPFGAMGGASFWLIVIGPQARGHASH